MFGLTSSSRHALVGLLTVASTLLVPNSAMAQSIADLTVTQIDAPDPARVGNILTYRLQITNLGPNPTGGVRLTAQIPSTSVLVFASPNCFAGGSPGQVTCVVPNLASGDSAWVSISVRPTHVGLITNFARVSSPVTIDPVQANDASVAVTTVIP